MNARTSAARAAASVVLAGAIALGTAGCGFFVPQATLIQYDPSDGVGTTVGSVKALNVILLLSDDGKTGSLLITLVNSSSTRKNVDLQFESGGTRTTVTKTVAGGSSASFGNTVGQTQILVDTATVKSGSLFPVYLQYGDVEGSQILVPVLPATDEHYLDLVPTPRPELIVNTPAPVETEAPAPTETPAP